MSEMIRSSPIFLDFVSACTCQRAASESIHKTLSLLHSSRSTPTISERDLRGTGQHLYILLIGHVAVPNARSTVRKRGTYQPLVCRPFVVIIQRMCHFMAPLALVLIRPALTALTSCEGPGEQEFHITKDMAWWRSKLLWIYEEYL